MTNQGQGLPHDRRTFLKGCAIAGITLVYAPPLIETLSPLPAAAATSPAPGQQPCRGCTGTYTLTLDAGLAEQYDLGTTVTLLCNGNENVLTGTVAVRGGDGATFTLGGTIDANGVVTLTISLPNGNLTLTGQVVGSCATITLTALTPATGATVTLSNSSLVRQ